MNEITEQDLLNAFPAVKAREMTNNSKNLKKHIYQAIKAEANEGRSSLFCYDVYGVDENVLKNIIKELTCVFYDVIILDDEESEVFDTGIIKVTKLKDKPISDKITGLYPIIDEFFKGRAQSEQPAIRALRIKW